MIRINLLPFRAARTKENVRRQVSVFILSLVLGALALGYYSTILVSKIEKLNTSVKDTEKQVLVYKKDAQEVDEIKKNLALLKQKTGVIGNLESDRKEPVRLLDRMTGMVIPKRMWLTSLEKKDTSVAIRGIAMDNKTVAAFMTRLEDSKLFKSVKLKNLRQEKGKKIMSLKSFEITCDKAPLKKNAVSKANKSSKA